MKQNDEYCNNRHRGYFCTQAPGHYGDHAARRLGTWTIIKVWPNVPKPPEPVKDEDVRAQLVEAMAINWISQKAWDNMGQNSRAGYITAAEAMLDGLIKKMKELSNGS